MTTHINISQLKTVKTGDNIVILYNDNTIKLFEVIKRHVGIKGRDGHTQIDLKNFVTDAEETIKIKNTLPENIKLIRKLSKGTNSRTLENAELISTNIMSDVEE